METYKVSVIQNISAHIKGHKLLVCSENSDLLLYDLDTEVLKKIEPVQKFSDRFFSNFSTFLYGRFNKSMAVRT